MGFTEPKPIMLQRRPIKTQQPFNPTVHMRPNVSRCDIWTVGLVTALPLAVYLSAAGTLTMMDGRPFPSVPCFEPGLVDENPALQRVASVAMAVGAIPVSLVGTARTILPPRWVRAVPRIAKVPQTAQHMKRFGTHTAAALLSDPWQSPSTSLLSTTVSSAENKFGSHAANG